ncbi:MAG TPA: redoxin domain-containing protein [Aggregatilineales bacterium]|jgi:peroxiredoxin|nr:redoxin domain-containing protein [Aggregatilineales bacterium]
MFETFELGPILHTPASSFTLPDHTQSTFSLDELMGPNGVMLGFIGDIWQAASVRRILWLQRHVSKFAQMGTPIALLVRDHAHTLYGFRMSSPLPVPFPLLADVDGKVHRAYSMDRHPGLLLIDQQRMLRYKWLMPEDNIWPKMPELVEAVQALQAAV